MANDKLKLITILQKQSSGKIPYETKYQIEDTNEIIVLKKEEGYPKGKFYFQNGEYFDIQMHYNSQFVEIKKEQTNPYYDEQVWDEFDKSLNKKDEEKQRDISYFNVTKIIEGLPRYKESSGKIGDIKRYDYALNLGFKFISTAKLYFILQNCGFVQFQIENEEGAEVYKLYDNEGTIGFLYNVNNEWSFLPTSNKIGIEYQYENNQSLGFYYSADNYLYIALQTLENYSQHLKPQITNDKNKNERSYGYQADSALKTLFAFSCECYLKSLLVLEGKNIKDLKELGHGLIELFTSLEPDTMQEIYNYYKYEKTYNFDRIINDKHEMTIEEFVDELSQYSLSFTDARYSAENSKNTKYEFLKELAFALREALNNKYILSYNITPFNKEITDYKRKSL